MIYQKNIMIGEIYVHDEYKRQGVATALFQAIRKKAEDEKKSERNRLMAMSEKELMVEMVLELQRVHTICNRIERKCYSIEDNQKK